MFESDLRERIDELLEDVKEQANSFNAYYESLTAREKKGKKGMEFVLGYYSLLTKAVGALSLY